MSETTDSWPLCLWVCPYPPAWWQQPPSLDGSSQEGQWLPPLLQTHYHHCFAVSHGPCFHVKILSTPLSRHSWAGTLLPMWIPRQFILSHPLWVPLTWACTMNSCASYPVGVYATTSLLLKTPSHRESPWISTTILRCLQAAEWTSPFWPWLRTDDLYPAATAALCWSKWTLIIFPSCGFSTYGSDNKILDLWPLQWPLWEGSILHFSWITCLCRVLLYIIFVILCYFHSCHSV